MEKIIITGGSGLVGKSLKKYLPNGIYLSSKDFDGDQGTIEIVVGRL